MTVMMKFEDINNPSNKWNRSETFHLQYFGKVCNKTFDISYGKLKNTIINFWVSLDIGYPKQELAMFKFVLNGSTKDHVQLIPDTHGIISLFIHFKKESEEPFVFEIRISNVFAGLTLSNQYEVSDEGISTEGFSNDFIINNFNWFSQVKSSRNS
ncbi:hypothetical protein RF11_12775 [Thelohanellus kitauei]|uniref:Uncharacterized protein n=1 Tax=Thelohanellus kitauei TaxID=669202 RepID=A0A0C2MI76_THEKT|nr:hypothetical protein RF11_12775 [Thelohanellus kitauei]